MSETTAIRVSEVVISPANAAGTLHSGVSLCLVWSDRSGGYGYSRSGAVAGHAVDHEAYCGCATGGAVAGDNRPVAGTEQTADITRLPGNTIALSGYHHWQAERARYWSSLERSITRIGGKVYAHPGREMVGTRSAGGSCRDENFFQLCFQFR